MLDLLPFTCSQPPTSAENSPSSVPRGTENGGNFHSFRLLGSGSGGHWWEKSQAFGTNINLGFPCIAGQSTHSPSCVPTKCVRPSKFMRWQLLTSVLFFGHLECSLFYFPCDFTKWLGKGHGGRHGTGLCQLFSSRLSLTCRDSPGPPYLLTPLSIRGCPQQAWRSEPWKIIKTVIIIDNDDHGANPYWACSLCYARPCSEHFPCGLL